MCSINTRRSVSSVLLAFVALGLFASPAPVQAESTAWGQHSPTLASVASTMTGCLIVGPETPTASEEVYLVWAGTPTKATLRMEIANAHGAHDVFLNGHLVGQVEPGLGGEDCDTDPVPVQWLLDDPGWVLSGSNRLEITNSANAVDTWYAVRGHFVLEGDITAAALLDSTFDSSYDGSSQQAVLQLPLGYDHGSLPLVVGLHGWSGERWRALKYWGLAANQQGWLFAAPEMHGREPHDPPGGRALASLASQYDVMDAVAYVNANYDVDPDRIYLVGKSMGGMIAATTAAKYPDRFAAAVDVAGITDLTAWHVEAPLWLEESIAAECGGTPEQAPFEYERRSSLEMAGNLLPLPLALVHGEADTTVLPHHAQDLYDAVQRRGGDLVELYWHEGGHNAGEYDPDWQMAWLANHVRSDAAPTRLDIHSDEEKPYFWLNVEYERGNQQHYLPLVLGSGMVGYVDDRDHWMAVEAEVMVDDQILVGSASVLRPVNLTIDLAGAGLPPGSRYAVAVQGVDEAVRSYTTITPALGSLTVSVPPGEHDLLLAVGEFAALTSTFTFTSSYDASLQQALLQLPPEYTGGSPLPLVIALHDWQVSPSEQLYLIAIAEAAAERGWLFAAPELHGEQPSDPPGGRALASRASQYDIMDTLAYMDAHYRVDPDRVYLLGRSMGGMIAATTAAKYPDRFAAVIDVVGATDLAAWYGESPSERQQEIAAECGGTPDQVGFEYERRSSLEMAGNLLPLPLALVHGEGDTTVPPHHAQDLYDAVQERGGEQIELLWHYGGHSAGGYGSRWQMDWLAKHVRSSAAPGRLDIRSDEPKSYFWLGIEQTGDEHWTAVQAEVMADPLMLLATVTDPNPSRLTIDLAHASLPPDIPYVVIVQDVNGGIRFHDTLTPTLGALAVDIPAGTHEIVMLGIA